MSDSNVNGRATHFSGLAISPRNLSSTTLTLSAKDAGKTIIFDIAATQTVTLPAATGTGNVFKFMVGITATDDKVIQVANSTDEFAGIVYQVDTDTGDALVAYPAVAADNYDTVTLNGTTTGGLIGDVITLTDIVSGAFLIEGNTMGTGIVATPLSAAV